MRGLVERLHFQRELNIARALQAVELTRKRVDRIDELAVLGEKCVGGGFEGVICLLFNLTVELLCTICSI